MAGPRSGGAERCGPGCGGLANCHQTINVGAMTAPVQDLFFEKLISRLVDSDEYLERNWLEDRLLASLGRSRVRYVLITGEPGAGKSSFAAGLARKNKRWLRYFIRRDQRSLLGGTGARTFLLQIGYQLAALYPKAFQPQYLEMRIRNRANRVAAGGQLVGVKVQQLLASPFFRVVIDISQHVQENQGSIIGLQVEHWVSDPHLLPIEDLAYMALIDPAAALLELQPQTQLVVMIDALDELRFHSGQEGLLQWLAACPDLPGNCKFLLTSRADHNLLEELRFRGDELEELEIAPEDHQVKQDAASYAHFLVRHPEVKDILGSPSAIAIFVDQAAARSEGNLGYLDAFRRALLHAAEAGDRDLLTRLLDYSALPSGLSSLYGYFLRLVRQSVENISVEIQDLQSGESHFLRAWPAVYHKILSMLAVAYEPLTADRICRMGGISASQVDVLEALSGLAQFLEGRHEFRLYHTSLADFLKDPQTAADPDTSILAVDAPGWHAHITRSLLRAHRSEWSESDAYGLQYILRHLLEADFTSQERDQLLETILTEPFIQSRGARFGWHLPLVQDLEKLKDVSPLLVMQTGLNVITANHRNSLANQEVLRLLRSVYGYLSPAEKSHNRPKEGSRSRLVYDLLDALEKPPADALNAIVPYLDPAQALDVRIKGVVVLAVGETHAPQALKNLEEILFHPARFVKNKRHRSHIRWCAADGLLALKDPACVQDLQTAFWTPQVKPWEQQVILYTLGRMHASLPTQELRQMIDRGLKNPQAYLPRVVDAIELLAPASGRGRAEWCKHYQGVLLTRLGLGDQTELRTWDNPLLIKRAVVALGRIGNAEVIVPLEGYLEEIEPGPMKELQKKNVLKAGERALDELHRRNQISI